MNAFEVLAVQFEPIPARRGLGRLISALMEGDPFAIGLVSVIAVGFIGYMVYQRVTGSDDE